MENTEAPSITYFNKLSYRQEEIVSRIKAIHSEWMKYIHIDTIIIVVICRMDDQIRSVENSVLEFGCEFNKEVCIKTLKNISFTLYYHHDVRLKVLHHRVDELIELIESVNTEVTTIFN